MINYILKITLLTLIFCVNSKAQTINSIVVNGNERISTETILVLGNISINENFEDKDLNIQSFRSKSFVFGIFLLAICIFRSFYLITPLDKYYYLH